MLQSTSQNYADYDGYLTEWYDRVPKIELHLHLEGSIPLDSLWELINKYGGDSNVTNIQSLRHRFQYKDFTHFMETWTWKNRFLREYEDFTFFSEAIARSLADQNIRYVEAFLSPARFFEAGLETGRLIEAVRRGLDRVESIEISLIPDLVRDLGVANANNMVSELTELRGLGIVGIGIGGSEHLYPAHLFKAVYEKAQNQGFNTTAHAGEAADANSVWAAIQVLKVDRIGHGTRAIEDKVLVQHLAQNRIPLELCPLSNVATGVVESIAGHPVRDFFDEGLMVTINTDDPMMFGNSMVQEFQVLEGSFGFTPNEIRSLILNGIDASWMSSSRKQDMKKSYQSDPAWYDNRLTDI